MTSTSLARDLKRPPASQDAGPPALQLNGITKTYGPTRANEDLSFSLLPGDVVGLIGANGAGKSTLMRILAGITLPDAGTLAVDGRPVDFARFSPEQARQIGIRIVHQELSLCDSLTVAENFYIEQPDFACHRLLWRRRMETLASDSIDGIFPDSGINVRHPVADLALAQRQMVEIARAASDPKLRVLILDEPTSSLDARRSTELQRFIAARAAAGVAIIFISHKLQEIATVAARLIVMRNGRLALSAVMREIDVPQMVAAMAGDAVHTLERASPPSLAAGIAAQSLVEIGQPFSPAPLQLCAGEIIGLAGLEGSGQREFLQALHAGAGHGVSLRSATAYVSGDRAAEGVFPLWTVMGNATLSRIAAGSALAWLRPAAEQLTAARWLDAVQLPPSRRASPILELSGGNQQKVLMARALIAEADVILLDDPTRGVDVSVKREFYRLIREAAEAGKLVVWYSSETIEFLECGRVLLFHDNAIRRVLTDADLSEEAIVSAAFAERLAEGGDIAAPRRPNAPSRGALLRLIPFLTTALIFLIITLLNHNAFTLFGIDLLLSAAVPLVLVALSQMFVVGGSEIDLSVGAFAGLMNVLSATFLVTTPLLGVAALAVALAAYVALGLLIQARAIPAIVVTLGASFIWAGLGYALQPSPGGSAPGWLSAAANIHPAGLPASVVAIILVTLLAVALNAARPGVVLRGFGANPRALAQSGWSPLAAAAMRYGAAGSLAMLAGLSMTAINTASDINAGGSYTLLSVAAVVIGGSALIGGRITPIGVVCGALSLSLIGSLLGFLSVSTDYNAAVQGGLLIGILVMRTVLEKGA
jgi:ribose transport system ATP-binding protein